MLHKNVPWLLLERYFAGTCRPEEQAELDSWLAGDPRRRLLADRLHAALSDTPPMPDQADIERAWTKLEKTISPSPNRTLTIAALLAAGVLALLGVAWVAARHTTH